MSFITITWRRLLREKLYALVCITSLALGITGSVLISLYLYSELTFDHYHQNHERIYRLSTELGDNEIAQSGFELGPLIVNDYPQYLDYVRFRSAAENRFDFGDNSNEWDDVFFADPSAFDIFTFTPVHGNPATALDDPYSIAISESFAAYYFGDSDPIGETLSTERFDWRVTLVFEDLPENVSQQYDALLPFETLFIYQPDTRDANGERFISSFNTYFLVSQEFDPDGIQEVSAEIFSKYIVEGFSQAAGNLGNLVLSHRLQQLSNLHFGPALIADDSTGNITNLYIFAAVVIALLLSGCINYVNLATARVATRTREVAIRKLVGADNRHLVLQFIGESVFFAGLAFLVGIGLSLVVIELGIMEDFTGKTELGELMLAPQSILLLVLAWLVIGMLTGIHPALKLAQPSMLAVMRPQQSPGRGLPLRELLVWVQMLVAIAIIASVFIMLRQSSYLLEAPLGFEKQHRYVVQLRGADEIRNRAALMQELRQHNEILNVTETTGAIGRSLSISIMPVETNTGNSENLTMNNYTGGEDFLETMGIELIEGDLERLYLPFDERGLVLVNETLVAAMEWNEPIGKLVGTNEVVGVVRDFHYLPMQQPIAPLFIMQFNDSFLDNLPPSRLDSVSIDLVIEATGSDEAAVRTYISDVVDRYSDQPIVDVRSLEAIWNDNYDDETRNIGVVAIFAGLSIVISLLGLGGMAAYNNERRGKEVAIRKVLGASVLNILVLLSRGMIKVLLLASVPAFLCAWYLSNLWLARFVYRIDPTFMPFLLALVIVALCSAAVMLTQTWRVARANPVQRIKYE